MERRQASKVAASSPLSAAEHAVLDHPRQISLLAKLKIANCARSDHRAGRMFYCPRTPRCGRKSPPLFPFDVHCYLQLNRGASPLSLQEKFF
jgi:hypothetical protein